MAARFRGWPVMHLRVLCILQQRVIVATLVSLAAVPLPARGGTLTPRPQQVIGSTTEYEFGSNKSFCMIYNSTLPLEGLRRFVAGQLKKTPMGQPTGFAEVCSLITDCSGCTPGIQIILHQFGTSPPTTLPPTLIAFPKMGQEGYILIVDRPATSVRVSVGANDKLGLWNGGMTAIQLLLRDAGSAEDSVFAQTIRDHPDHSVRGAHWLEVTLPQQAGVYVVDSVVREKIDFLRRHKINALLYQQPEVAFYDSNWASAPAGRDGGVATRQLSAYCDSLNLAFIPAGGIVPPPLPCTPLGGGCERYYSRREYVDGWWSREQRFVFAMVNSEGLQYNGSFELDWTDDGAPDGWEFRDSKLGSAWMPDRDEWWDGDVSMKLVENPAIGRPKLWQQLGVPDTLSMLPPDEAIGYGLRIHVWRRNVAGSNLYVRVTPRDSTGRTDLTRGIDDSLSSYPGWKEWEIWKKRLWLKNGDRAIEFMAQLRSGGVDTLRIDRLQILPVVGAHVATTVPPVQEAVPGEKELISNGGMEALGLLGLPANWSDTLQAGWGYTRNGVSRWSRDTTVRHSGSASAKLYIQDSLVANPNSSNIILVQVIPGPIDPGTYRLTAWGKTDWRNRCRPPTGACDPDSLWFFPQVNIYAVQHDGAIDTTEVRWRLLDRSYRKVSDWTYYQSTLALPAERQKLVVYSRILSPSYGTIWIDDVSLRKLPSVQPMKNLLVHGDMEACCDTIRGSYCYCYPAQPCPSVPLPTGWQPPWGCLSSTTAAWSMVYSPTPCDSVHSGQRALKLVVQSDQESNENVALASVIPDTLPAGRYLLTAWGRVQGLQGTPPQVTLVASWPGKPTRTASILIDGTATSWKRYSLVFPVAEDSVNLYVYSRFRKDGHGTLFLDDVSVRRLDGDLGNLLGKGYEPVVRDTTSGSDPYASTSYEVRRPLVTATFEPDAAPGRILRKDVTSGAIPEGRAVRLSYDQYFDVASIGMAGVVLRLDQGLNICATNVLDDFFIPSVQRLVSEGFLPGIAKAVVLPPTEILGYNRGGLCRSSNPATFGDLEQSNAKRLAGFANTLITTAKTIDAAAVVYNWSDEWSLFHRGGNWYDQIDFGGPPGKSANAIQTTTTDSTLDRSTRIISWWYEPANIAHLSRSAQYFQGAGYAQLQATWHDTVNMTQAAAVSRATNNCLGGVVTTWDYTNHDHREDIKQTSSRFWNTPWRQVYFADLNPTAPPSSITTSGGASINTDDSLMAAPPLYPPGRNLGCIKLVGSEATLTLPELAIDNSSSYLLILHARGAVAPNYSDTKTIRVKPRWVRPNGSTFDGADSVKTVGGPGPGDDKTAFNRYTFGLNRPAAAVAPDRLRVIINVDAQAGTVGIDNLALWETLPQCVNADLDLLSAPALIDLGAIPAGPCQVEFILENRGCRDIRVTQFSTSPAGRLTSFTPVAPLILPPNVTKSIRGNGTASPGAQSYTILIDYRLSNPSTSPMYQQQITVTYVGEQ